MRPGPRRGSCGYYPEAAIIARQARELGIEVPLLGGDGWVGDALKNGREALRNCFISNHYSGDNPDPVVQDFVKAYRVKFSREPDSIAALAYDAVKVLTEAMTRASSTEGPKVRDALATSDVLGVTGRLKMNAQRNVEKPAVIQEVTYRDGDVHFVSRPRSLPTSRGSRSGVSMEVFLQQLINGLSLGAIYALIALGYTMVYGVLRLINFAHGDVYMLGAFAGYFITEALNLDRNPSILGAIVVTLGAMAICAVIGVLIERFAYRPVRHHSRLTSLITAIGVSLLLEYGGQVVFTANPRFFPQMIRQPTLRGADHEPEPADHRRRGRVVRPRVRRPPDKIGKAMRATSFNLSVAKLMGINTNLVISFTFALGSALAAAAGVLVALAIPKIDPLMGLLTGLKAFVAAVLGGIGNIPGAMLGGMLIGLMEAWIGATAYSTYRDAVAFGVLILILLFRPSGILGSTATEKV